MLYAVFFIAVLLLLFGLLSIPAEKKNQAKRRVEQLLNDEIAAAIQEEQPKESFRKRVFQPFWAEMKKTLLKRMPGKQAEKLDKQLLQAGNPFHMKAAEFRIFQLALLIGMPVLALGYGGLLGFKGGNLIVFFVIGLVVGILLPRQYIKMKIAGRKKIAIRELADFVDLLLVSLEAGLGFDSALGKVIGKQEGVLAKEFRRCLEEMRLGLTRREALMGVRDRLEVEEISAFINSVLRAEKLGVGMVQVLRILTADVRTRRRQRAEETAMKAPIKILFPLVFFIFPSLFIVILGPVAIQLIHQFL